jgi:hypothetical protein
VIGLASWDHRSLYITQQVSNTAYTVTERPLSGTDPVPSVEAMLGTLISAVGLNRPNLIRSKLLFSSDLEEMLELYKDAGIYAQFYYCDRSTLAIELRMAGDLRDDAFRAMLLKHIANDRHNAVFPYELKISLAQPSDMGFTRRPATKSIYNI